MLELTSDRAPAGAAGPASKAAACPDLLNDLHKWLFAERSDLHQHFDLSKEIDQARFLAWWMTGMSRQYRAGREAVDWEYFARQAPGADGPFASLITIAMRVLWLLEPELQERFDLDDPTGRARYACWYYERGMFRAGTDMSAYLAKALPSLAAPCSPDEAAAPINRFAAALLATYPDDFQPLAAAGLEVMERFFAPVLARRSRSLLHTYQQLPFGCLPAPTCQPSSEEPSLRGEAHGANLVGYAHGAFGMAEHVRMTARALSCKTDRFSIVNVDAYVHERQPERDVLAWTERKERYRTNIFHVNADAMAGALASLGARHIKGAYNIGYWAWELAKVPAAWQGSIDFVDEIWAPSRFIQEAFQSATAKPVLYMPLCVELAFSSWKRRSDLGLPERPYLFLYYFDSYSYYQRKNPYAALRAFKTAFPDRRDVGLVVKSQYASEDSPQWRQLMELAGDDPRITVINRTMTKSEIMSLQAECDCFVSLHRSEGFGRGPAEAMWLGKPVIVTGYSGNVDFTRPDNALLVDYAMVDVKKDEYPFWEGQVWADPDEEHAAALMRRLVEDPALGREIGRRAAATMRAEFSYEAIGARYEARLKELGALL
jgi:glycosyltransferase involved in cell wall biosynthesis